VNGSYAEYILAEANYVGKLPSQLSFEEAAPILCAGVTAYKGLKELEIRAGEWVVISGIGGLGHLGVQYAKAMGMNVVAVDIDSSKLDLAKRVGADLIVNCKEESVIDSVQKQIGGAHGVLVTAVSKNAFQDAVGMLRRKGTVSLTGLPAGSFPLSIFDFVLSRKTVRGSIVGTRQDLNEALQFAAEGKVKCIYTTQPFNQVNAILDQMDQSKIEGRVVMKIRPEIASKRSA
jgi:propanol-preferring alcohol dehydrogenase